MHLVWEQMIEGFLQLSATVQQFHVRSPDSFYHIWKYELAEYSTCPEALIVDGNVCDQTMLVGVLHSFEVEALITSILSKFFQAIAKYTSTENDGITPGHTSSGFSLRLITQHLNKQVPA
ncbi:hypothetical protein Plhal304r1_c030g0098651 [Plasmopara halstedii]